MSQAAAALHTVDAAEVALELGSDPARGLSAEEARVRLAESGPNELHRGEKVRPGRILLDQLTSPMLLLLAGAGVLSAVLGKVPEALVICVVVILNAWIGFRQEYRAERAMASLRAMATPTVKVLRDGAPREIPARQIVPGDLVLLEAGAHVPADGRLAEAFSLRVDESALTGESAPVQKQVGAVAASAPLAERMSMAYPGTSVTAGHGKFVVTATGTATELGHVADLLEGADSGRTPLQLRLDTLVKRLALIAGVIVLFVFVLGLLRGEELDTLLLTAVSLAVAAIPDSLPAVVTITLWDAGEDAWQTVLFTSIAFAELAGGFAMRSERVSLQNLGIFTNRALVGAVALTVALQALLVAVPFLRNLLGLQPLTAAQWVLVIAIALTYLVVIELDKALQRRATASATA